MVVTISGGGRITITYLPYHIVLLAAMQAYLYNLSMSYRQHVLYDGYVIMTMLLLLLSTPLHQRAASRVQHPNHVAANSLSPQLARKGSTLSGFVQRSRLEREVGRDLDSNKWEEV